MNQNVIEQLGGEVEKLFTMFLWKLAGDKPIVLKDSDIKAFINAHGGTDGIGEANPKLMIHGTEDGLIAQVMTEEKAKKYVAEYEAMKKGLVIDTDADAKGS